MKELKVFCWNCGTPLTFDVVEDYASTSKNPVLACSCEDGEEMYLSIHPCGGCLEAEHQDSYEEGYLDGQDDVLNGQNYT